MVKENTVRVMVTQGYCLLRNALIERVKREPWIEVCAVASEMEETRKLISQYKPHVLVMNVSLKCSAGISSLKKLKRDYFWLAVVALSCDSEFENVYAGQALRAGADAYVSSEDSLDDLIRAIRSAAGQAGHSYMSPAPDSRRWATSAKEEVLCGLSRREAEVFCLTGCGYVPQRIADKMDLSVKTVESYRERIRKKMDLAKGADLLYVSTSFMRSAARRGIEGSDEVVVRELLSAIG